MNELMNFNFENNKVRVHMDSNNNPWWVAKDVCKILGIKNSRQATSSLDPDELVSLKLTSGGQLREIKAVNESGLYALIFKSRSLEAKRFRKWVTSEVLPQIRKTGKYSVKEPSRLEILTMALDSEKKRLEAESKVLALTAEKAILEPKARYSDMVINAGGTRTISSIAKQLGMRSPQQLNDFLKDLGIQYKRRNCWYLTCDYSEEGYTHTNSTVISRDDQSFTTQHLKWTEKGVKFIFDMYEKYWAKYKEYKATLKEFKV